MKGGASLSDIVAVKLLLLLLLPVCVCRQLIKHWASTTAGSLVRIGSNHGALRDRDL